MGPGGGWRRIVGAVFALLLLPAAASAQVQPPGTNDFGGFRNVLPGGQGQTVNATELVANQATGQPPASFVDQLGMYRDLVYGASGLTADNLGDYFKPAGFGVPDPNARTEDPKAGVKIVRDSLNVPHVYGTTRADTAWGAGYASAEDRLFMMDVLRHTGRGRLSEFAGPGANDSNLNMDLEQLRVSDYTEAELQQMIDTGVRDAGAEGAALKADLDAYVDGINVYIGEARNDPSKLPGEYPALGKMPEDWKPTDTVAVATLIGGIFGKGGGAEVNGGQVLRAAQERFRGRRARRVFRDFRRQEDPEAPVTVKKRFPFDNPGRVKRRAVALPDLGSVKYTQPLEHAGGSSRRLSFRGPAFPRQQSNALLVSAQRSQSGHALAVMGPQVGYYSPEILMEMDLHGPGIDARGATFPGISLFILLGRGRDFAWSATTATTDDIDQFIEKLCEPDGSAPNRNSDHYLYKGRCIPFLKRDHVLHIRPAPVDFLPGGNTQSRDITIPLARSVHGPVQGTATVGGKPVAIANARATYFHELDSARAFERLNGNQVHDGRSFQEAMNFVNFAFNWFYVDDHDIAYLQSGWYPRRAKGTDPNLPIWGTGTFDWKGFDPAPAYTSRRMSFKSLPKTINPRQGYIVNWNNKQAPGWRSADDNWVYSSVHRSQRLEKRLRAALRRGKITLIDVVKAMADAATVDLRGQEAYPWIRRVIGRPGSAEVEQLLGILDSWQRNGSHRRDLDKDGFKDEGAAVALMDAWWSRLLRGMFQPVLGAPLVERIQALASFDQPANTGGSSYFTGWWGYVDKDLRAVLGRRVRGKLSRRYCGRGSRSRCRAVLVDTLVDAARAAREKYGANLSDWKVPIEQIEFTAAGAVGTPSIPWQDRPTFQQAVEVQGHRPR
jgi:acyl-homoserine lactone acylase PvdQ